MSKTKRVLLSSERKKTPITPQLPLLSSILTVPESPPTRFIIIHATPLVMAMTLWHVMTQSEIMIGTYFPSIYGKVSESYSLCGKKVNV